VVTMACVLMMLMAEPNYLVPRNYTADMITSGLVRRDISKSFLDAAAAFPDTDSIYIRAKASVQEVNEIEETNNAIGVNDGLLPVLTDEGMGIWHFAWLTR